MSKTKHIDLKPYLHGKNKAVKRFICAHFNLLQRFLMAMHWFRAYKIFELKHDNLNYDLYKVRYGNKTLFTIGTSAVNPLCAFIKGWFYYPYYYKFEQPHDINLEHARNHMNDWIDNHIGVYPKINYPGEDEIIKKLQEIADAAPDTKPTDSN